MQNKLVSVIVVNFNGIKWLRGCLESLMHQTYKNIEIIFVDNASSDDSVKYILSKYPKVKVVQNETNVGFAEGNNIGVKHSKGEYVLLLNNDTEVDYDFVTKFTDGFKKIPTADVLQSKIVYLNDHTKIDSCGSFWTKSSMLYYIGNSKNASNSLYSKPFRVFSVKGASMLIKKEVINKIGLFDSSFWSYYEETDFCHRAWISGFEVWYWPDPICYHALGGTSLKFPNQYIQFHNFKNKLHSILKNFEVKSLIYYLPVYLMMNIIICVSWILSGKYGNAISLPKSIAWNIRNIKSTLSERQKIQTNRARTDSEVNKICMVNPRLSYYKSLLTAHFENYEDKL